MKKILPFLVLLLSIPAWSQQQAVNVNPDPNGEAWIVGGLRELTAQDYIKLEALPKLRQSANFRNTRDLPFSVDNTIHDCFRPVFNQEGGSCGQASGIAYNYTYEVDRIRGLSANTPTNQYPTHYTWDFLNGGNGGGSWYWDGWEIINANGVPDVETYGGHFASGGDTRWMSGYDEYYAGMQNRTLEVYSIDISTPEGLQTLKQWMYDHGDESPIGGLANFGAGATGYNQPTLPYGTPQAGKAVITQWGTSVNHAMTFVGYNDSIRYDFNSDGQYTNDIDITGDGQVDMQDWEIGGLQMVNSWGTWWGDQGKSYVAYRTLALPVSEGGIWNGTVHVMKAKASYQPLLTMKTTIKHNSRNKLRITAGVSADPQATEPEYVVQLPLFNYQGGDLYMQGGYASSDQTIEIGLDITPLLGQINANEEARFFLYINEKDPTGAGTGEIINYSLLDYTAGGEEIACNQQNVSIEDNTTTLLWVNRAVDFEKVEITTNTLEQACMGLPYSCQLDADGGEAPYKWRSIIEYTETAGNYNFPAQTEQLTPYSDDDGYAVKDIEFDFPFFGKTYNHIVMTTDGSLQFTESFDYIRNPSNLLSHRCITPYGADLMLYASDNDGMWYDGDDEKASFVWKTSQFENPGYNAYFACTLHKDGKIEFFYGDDITENADWVSGLSDGNKESYLFSSISGQNTPAGHTALEFSGSDFPTGLELSETGLLTGTPDIGQKTYDLKFKVIDNHNIFNIKTLSLQVNDPNGLATLNHESGFSIFPNPAVEQCKISMEIKTAANIKLELYSQSGRLLRKLYQGHLAAGTQQITVNTQELSAGIYFIRCTQAGSTSALPLMVK